MKCMNIMKILSEMFNTVSSIEINPMKIVLEMF